MKKRKWVIAMETIISILILLCIIGILAFLLPIILPLVLIIVVAVGIYIWYLRRKMMKHLEEDEEIVYTFEQENTDPNQDIIDVEYSEREEEE